MSDIHRREFLTSVAAGLAVGAVPRAADAPVVAEGQSPATGLAEPAFRPFPKVREG